jgi:hypothetical protein
MRSTIGTPLLFWKDMVNKILLTLIILTISIFNPRTSYGSTNVSVASASLKNTQSDQDLTDIRVTVLRNYLESKNSPLSGYASDFIKSADENGLDWRLVPSITGVESSFGKRMPYNSYNAYGWANGNYYFNSWEESIDHVNKTLKTKYVDRGRVSVHQIGRVYAPPSPTWPNKVLFFMNQIDPVPVEFDL